MKFQPRPYAHGRHSHYATARIIYNIARANLLAVVLLSLVNVLLMLKNADYYFLFSAYIPLALVLSGMYNCGKLPPDWYEYDMYRYEFLEQSHLDSKVVAAIAILALYLLFYLLARKQHSGWLIAALVMFSIDTLAFLLMGGLALTALLDIICHGAVIALLIGGIVAANRLKTMPPDEDLSKLGRTNIDIFPDHITLLGRLHRAKICARYLTADTRVRGKLWFYQDRILFIPNTLHSGADSVALLYADMTSAQPYKHRPLQNGLLIHTRDGAEHRLLLPYRGAVVRLLGTKLTAAQS